MIAASALILLASCLFFPSPANAQEKADAQKVYADVAGTYEFSYEGQSLVVIFTVRDGRLYGAEASGSEEAEIKPVDLEKLKFETTVGGTGQYYEIGFARDEQGTVSKCQLISSGVVLDGTRVK
jgi:hypothetical protein